MKFKVLNLASLNICTDCYRFGFNGQERNDEISGLGNHNTAEYWEYDPRLGRRWNIDPFFVEKPWMAPYHAFSNKPILNVDPNGARDDEYEVNGETGSKKKISNAGGNDVDFNHFVGGANNGKTEIVDKSTGISTWMNSSEYMKGYTHRGKDGTGHEVTWEDIFNEFKEGKGPEKSLVYGTGARMNREIIVSPQFQEAYADWQENGRGRFLFKGSFGPSGAIKAGDNMTAQMIGKANISFYPVGKTLVIMVVDSKSITSWSLNPFAKGESRNVPRVNGMGGPESTTHQTYMFHLPLTVDPQKIAGGGR